MRRHAPARPATRLLPRLPGGLPAATLLATIVVVSVAWAQLPSTALLLPTDNTASTAGALALDQRIIAEAKNGPEIMTSLTYLSDVIGPRLTGSAALKRANDWTADRMRSYGLTNVHLEGWTIPAGWERG